MQRIKLKIMGLSVSQNQSGAYALVLKEEDGPRRIPIIIGPVEAQSIAIQLEGIKPPRPLTHDLFKSLSVAFGIELLEVFIYKLEEGIFYAEMVCEMDGREIRIDSRTSDAAALALRFKCPLFTTEEILRKAGIVLDVEQESPVAFPEDEEEIVPYKKQSSEFRQFSLPELESLLNEAIQNEDYERASTIRDEINRRK